MTKHQTPLQEHAIIIPCSCQCCDLVVKKFVWCGEDVNYSLCIEDSYYDNNINGIFGRIKRAIGVLFGKPVAFNEVFIEGDAAFDKILDELADLRAWTPEK